VCLIVMSDPEWKYTETVQKRIRVIKINHQERHLDAQDIDSGFVLCLDANEGLDLGKIKKAKMYQATIKVYKAELTVELERQLTEMAIRDTQLDDSLKAIRKAGNVLKKYELAAIGK
jgi:hypothetical protein